MTIAFFRQRVAINTTCVAHDGRDSLFTEPDQVPIERRRVVGGVREVLHHLLMGYRLAYFLECAKNRKARRCHPKVVALQQLTCFCIRR